MIQNKGVKTTALLVAVAFTAGFVVAAGAQVVNPDVSKEAQTVRQVLAAESMKKAMGYVERVQQQPDDLIQEWLSLCNAYAPEGDEIQRSRLLYKLFKIYGLESVHIDQMMNVIGIRPGTGGGPALVLNAHHDNVALWPRDQRIEAFVADKRIWCPAASDDLIGVMQFLGVLRALNAGNVQTKGDVWFVGLTGEEVVSRGSHQFVRAHYPHTLDWRKGDAIVQFHGGAGEGVTSGSNPVYHMSQLRIFTPFDKPESLLRWMPSAVDALAKIITRIRNEVWDPRTAQIDFRVPGQETKPELLFMNMSKLAALPIDNAPQSETTVFFDLRAQTVGRLNQAHADIRRIAAEVCAGMPKPIACRFIYQLNGVTGTEKGIDGWDKANNAAARMATAASNVLYGTKPFIDPTQGCGDCLAAFMEGMPMMSLRGRVIDRGGGKIDLNGRDSLESEVRRRTTGHDVTQSAAIDQLWAGIKHGLAFTVAYVGLAEGAAATKSESTETGPATRPRH